LAALALVGGAGMLVSARGELPAWIRTLEAGNALEAVFFRAMSLPGGTVLGRRPPAETRPALTELIQKQPAQADLYSLRALESEQQLDFASAESDWKRYVQYAPDPAAANLALADFYHRRLRPRDEIAALLAAAQAPPTAEDRLAAANAQRSWSAFGRIFDIIQQQRLPREVFVASYRAWMARYPREASLYVRFFQFLLQQKDYAAARQLIADYRGAFADDAVFPVKANALLEYSQGSVEKGLAVYEQSFDPLWPAELVQGYFELMKQTHTLRQFRDRVRAELVAEPASLDAATRLFYYFQQQGNTTAAQQSITNFRLAKDGRKLAWTARELYVCARLLEAVHAYPEAARFYFALYNRNEADAPERALAGLADILLTAPEQPIRFGAGHLAMYRDIATLDQGPGFLNGILSLILNSTSPAYEFSEAEARATPYFHRARAAELIALLDQRFPQARRRAELHAKLIAYYANAAQAEAVIATGRAFLASFPSVPERTSVALLMADAYARTGNTKEEFAIYDAALSELAAAAERVPLGEQAAAAAAPPAEAHPSSKATGDDETGAGEEPAPRNSPRTAQAFQVEPSGASAPQGPRSPEYARVLERYLARLTALRQINQAIAVLRHEMDRNPNDPGIYQRLATFLEQNQLGAEQEEVYRLAIAQFQSTSWYDKLARFYIRYRRDAEFEKLTQQVVKIFKGSDLEGYFNGVVNGRSPELYLRVNQYANQRFPHDPVFVRNLLQAYSRKETLDRVAWETLLRAHWAESEEFRNLFFEFLSRSGKLESELAGLRNAPAVQVQQWTELTRENPLAAQFLAAAEIWRSHYEAAAPVLQALAVQYPADVDIGRRASTVYRSLAYVDPAATDVAVNIEKNLLAAMPGSVETLARIGDIYADRGRLAEAAAYWDRIPQVVPGNASGYLETATIYWDYFDYDNALRVIREGRRRLDDPDLGAYEAGAIHENRRDYPAAVAEYLRATQAAKRNAAAQTRLIQLAGMPAARPAVEEATTAIAGGKEPAIAAIELRIAVLEASNRAREVAGLLDSLLERSNSLEFVEAIEALAQRRSLDAVRRHALEKRASLTPDPVERIQLHYALASLYEAHKELPAAQRVVEELYRQNPKILGVVRATVDFYWRNHQREHALQVLQAAAAVAYPAQAAGFRYEAARKATEAGQTQLARGLLGNLLSADPYHAEYLAAMADTYSQAGDDAGLRQFYSGQIEAFRRAPLSGAERAVRIAALRRGLIPALTRLKQYDGAVEQYIELINQYPEDEAIAGEAALYAARYDRRQQLAGFYQRAVATSPRDYRWPVVLARIEVGMEDFPAAVEAYGKAIVVRPDRADLRAACAALQERLFRFDEAADDYQRLYELTYKDPRWMRKVAEIRARQGRAEAAVEALRAGFLTGHPEIPSAYFEVARQLAAWNLLAPAREFAERGVQLAGSDLLAVTDLHAGARLYAEILTRLRQQDAAFTRLQRGMSDADAMVPVVMQQMAKNGITSAADADARRRTATIRRQNAQNGLADVLRAMGAAAQRYFTPEEKSALERYLAEKQAAMSEQDAALFILPLAESAGLNDLEVRVRTRLMMAHRNDAVHARAVIDLQTRRMKFAELGALLERYAATQPLPNRAPTLSQAADAYRSLGDRDAELRVRQTLLASGGSSDKSRYFALLLDRRRPEIITLAGRQDAMGEAAANYLLANGGTALAHAAVNAYGAASAPVWKNAYTALVGLYFSEAAPEVNRAFTDALGATTIGERLGKPVDRSRTLAGSIWFYYGGRYGEYLGATRQGDPEDYLPAMLEQAPAQAEAYAALGDYYADAGRTADALANYQHAVEFDARRPDLHDRMAVLQVKAGKRAQAVAEWRAAFAGLLADVNLVRVPERFWPVFTAAVGHVKSNGAFGELQPDIESVLRQYVRKNGNYRSAELLEGAYLAAGANAAATQWLLNIVSVNREAAGILKEIVEQDWLPLAQREPLYRRILEDRFADANSDDSWRRSENNAWRLRFARYLIDVKQYDRARQTLDALPDEARSTQEVLSVQLLLAARAGALEAALAGYRAAPARAPAAESLRRAANELSRAGESPAASKLLEFLYTRELEQQQLSAANLLGLAEIRLRSGDVAGAMQLLRRLTLVVGEPFANLDVAASLLESKKRPAEAAEFLEQLVRATPWDQAARTRLAQARLQAGQAPAAVEDLRTVAADAQAPYAVRVQAAQAIGQTANLRQRAADTLGSRELNLLAGGAVLTPAAADQPYFHRARLEAAAQAKAERLRLLAGALADYPNTDALRVPLFRAANSARREEFALAAVAPLLNRGVLYRVVPVTSAVERLISAEPPPEDASSEQEAEAPPAAEVPYLNVANRLRLASEVAAVEARLGRLEPALEHIRLALGLKPTGATLQSLTARRNELEAALRRQKENAARRPVIHAALEQDHLVRPQLLVQSASSTPAQAGAAKGGAR
jgi:tetratricopeptide (TPR) repeat protein